MLDYVGLYYYSFYLYYILLILFIILYYSSIIRIRNPIDKHYRYTQHTHILKLYFIRNNTFKDSIFYRKIQLLTHTEPYSRFYIFGCRSIVPIGIFIVDRFVLSVELLSVHWLRYAVNSFFFVECTFYLCYSVLFFP